MRRLTVPGLPRDLALALAGMAAGASMVVVAVGALPVASPPHPQPARAARVAAPTAAPPATAPPPAAPVSPPTRLTIPAIGVDAAVEPVGLGGGAMAVPRLPADVGWYRYGVRPGQPGDAVVDGHLDWTTGPAVFWHLSSLKVGATLEITEATGAVLRFRVLDTRTVPYDRAPPDLFAAGGPPRLSLITCAGAWDAVRQVYRERLVVDAIAQP